MHSMPPSVCPGPAFFGCVVGRGRQARPTGRYLQPFRACGKLARMCRLVAADR